MKKFMLLIILSLCCKSALNAEFDVSVYKEYLKTHKDINVNQLLAEYPAGLFSKDAFADIDKSHYGDSVVQKFALTDYEKQLISKNGFMVTERLSYPTFLQAYRDIYNKDLPAYISADAILHALHFSFNRILATLEETSIIPQLDSALKLMKADIPKGYIINAPEEYTLAINDLDVYLTVAQYLLMGNSLCVYPENASKVLEIIKLIENRSPAYYALFSSTKRNIDFSQFTPRGHYTLEPYLTQYFLAMMWLGRTEIYISNSENTQDMKQTEQDLHRMTILSALIAQTSKESGAYSLLQSIDRLLTFMLGEQDNITLFNAGDALNELSLTAFEICDSSNYQAYKNKMLAFSGANQLYNSQIIMSDPFNPNQVKLSSVFLMMGQRPIIDGYITANVVYDRIMYKYEKVTRMVPSSLDVLFGLGNDAAIQLLMPELKKYPYSTNLAGLRYLIDSYGDDFWKSSIYTNWLSAIRSLNPPAERTNLPNFMKTAAWWQKTMNTQLASWAELRHDFILYSKQPYTYGLMCSFPYSFVEPVPDFFSKIKQFFVSLKEISYAEMNYRSDIDGLCNKWITASEKLLALSEKSLNNIEYSDEDRLYIDDMVYIGGDACNPQDTLRMGWYPSLYFGMTFDSFNDYLSGRILDNDRNIIADVHTIPMDENGSEVGWVFHIGTGKVNLAVITTEKPDGGQRTYTGAVSSYYEFLSNNYKRYTDGEWRAVDLGSISRPTFTNLFLADNQGKQSAGPLPSLFVSTATSVDATPSSESQIKVNCYPNPASGNVHISFNVTKPENSLILDVYDLGGNLVKQLINEPLAENKYLFIWDALDSQRKRMPSGTYIISLKIGSEVISEKIIIQ